MKIHSTPLNDAFIIEIRKFGDARGYFMETFHHQKFSELSGYDGTFVQDNQAFSFKNVVRGLHFQCPPYAQSKLVRVISGKILDVIVDLRKGSSTFGQWFGVELNDENNLQLFVPKGFAHGYSVLSDTALVAYKCDEYYHPESESGIYLLDTDVNIDWEIPEEQMIISEKDASLKPLSDISKELLF